MPAVSVATSAPPAIAYDTERRRQCWSVVQAVADEGHHLTGIAQRLDDVGLVAREYLGADFVDAKLPSPRLPRRPGCLPST